MTSEYQEIAILMIISAVLGIFCLIRHYREEFLIEREKERAAAKAHNDKWSQVYAARLEADSIRSRKHQQPEEEEESYSCDDDYCATIVSTLSTD